MKRARTVDEYVALVKDALYEVEDMRAAIDFDSEGMGEAPKFIDDLEDTLKGIFTSMQEGTYCWRTGDLAYMEFVRNMDESAIPFRTLLVRINDTHKNGLETDDED
ncbi:MAG: general secretion pathway protein GspF [Gammaproteobacteria bacterium]|nr:general secretion pathway protein GspF [Gammaproteobacteria bacterium]